jgi:hypothetical protein
MEFKPSKSHKKLMKKVAKFLNDTPTGKTWIRSTVKLDLDLRTEKNEKCF